MIDFALSDEQNALRALARRFSRTRVLPLAVPCDIEERFPREILAEAHDIGLLQAQLPERHGGGGLGVLEHALLVEELAYGCSGIEASLLGSSLAIHAIKSAGSEEQQRRIYGQLAAEPTLIAFAVTEPDAGSDVAAITTRCRRVGSDWLLSGQKAWITNATLAKLIVVFATEDSALGRKGIAAFIVSQDAPGVSVGKREHKLGQRASDTASLFFDEVLLPPSAVLAAPGAGFSLAMSVFERGRCEVAAIGTGIMQRCLDDSLSYATSRRSFGKAIAEHQLVAKHLADMSIAVEASRVLYQRAAWGLDLHTGPSLSSHAKAFAAEQAVAVASSAVQIFGANGYSRDFPVEKLYRDAKVLQIYEGTSEIQRLIIARNLTQR